SDGTSLLSWALTCAGVRGIHGPVVGQLPSLSTDDHQALFDLLESDDAPGVVGEGLAALGATGEGALRGQLIAGNLCLQTHLVGTQYSALRPGCVPLIEDVGERPYAIDRYLTHLWTSGALEGVEAMVIGDFSGCVETKMKDTPEVFEVIDERLASFGIVGLRLEGVGHGAGNRALPFGGRVEVEPSTGRLRVLEPAVI
ncbi:MAG: hypothetical protein KJO07_14065, partial [Deltaproteobacteria bacterium]|nr:hypothetical protein [Deltaproteobacteria bacterium]